MKKIILIFSLIFFEHQSFSQELDSLDFFKYKLSDSIHICNGEAEKAFRYYKKYFENHDIKNHKKFFKKYMVEQKYGLSFRNNYFEFIIYCNCDDSSYPNCLIGGVVFYKRKIERFYFSQ